MQSSDKTHHLTSKLNIFKINSNQNNKNQIEILKQMDKYGLAKYSGFIEHLEPVEFADSFFDFINDQKKLILMKKMSMETFDGYGIPRMIKAIKQL